MSEASIQFDRLVDIVARLRALDGCPWDREQTIGTLRRYVLEEAYEVIEAIDQENHPALCEEIGDLLLEAVFVAQIESEDGRFSIADSARAVADKLVRRHPHVFAQGDGEAELETAEQVRRKWEESKAAERGSAMKPGTLLSGIPAALPALLRAYQVGSRAASVGFDWRRASQVIDKMREEIEEIGEVVDCAAPDPARLEEEVGDFLLAIANLSRKLGVEPEAALRKANDKFTQRFTAMETRIAASGRQMSEMSLDELEQEWQRIKADRLHLNAASNRPFSE